MITTLSLFFCLQTCGLFLFFYETIYIASAEKELYIADFYFKRGQKDPAAARYKKLIELYPESASAEEAKKKLARWSAEKPAAELKNEKSGQ